MSLPAIIIVLSAHALAFGIGWLLAGYSLRKH